MRPVFRGSLKTSRSALDWEHDIGYKQSKKEKAAAAGVEAAAA
ncbi:MAG: hypothetical protein OXH92_09285 [Bryobacterales bacterium]|nr:hypothetical protein [Bryobacterales bacterium]MDE0434187.1 hypothetical protein [Bryobacterales bacterium]